ncbi:MAG TPA: methylated-DNA--[protein]-cysteine S-methyltransferase [Peptococcaceae bacterium]|nr:methylated-DNA--[protein]-cysteine S-methyltransferase [Peptococcaceae bacterium]
MDYITSYSSPLGEITLASDGRSLTGLWFEKRRYCPDFTQAKVVRVAAIPVFRAAQEWLDRYFAGEKPGIAELPLAPAGGDFRKAVWRILCEIPYGSVTTYGEIAKRIAAERGLAKMAAQAVGGAVGHNPISIIIPCHRVVGSNGSLTGYGGGIDLKVKLLTLEGVDMSKLFIPRKGTAL